ncbi:MAG: OmpH family outer membrane protein [Bacteroidaceae bacterium]|nr:OmpH family outer membrane protein [Bacteroidaceae bacterium]
MKKLLIMALGATLVLTACKGKQDETLEPTTATEVPEGGLKIAYIQVDTLMSQYQFYKDKVVELNRHSENVQNTLQQKATTLQQKAAQFQRNYDNNVYTTREQVEGVQASLQREQQQLAELEQRLQQELALEADAAQQALLDSLNNFLKQYNAQRKFDYIISNVGNAPILLANPQYDITAEVVAGLNKRYKPTAAASGTAADSTAVAQ